MLWPCTQTWRGGYSLHTRTGGIQVSDALSSDSLSDYLQRGRDASFCYGVRLKSPGRRLKTKVESMATITPLYTRAGEIEQGKTVVGRDIDTAFSEWAESMPWGS